MGPTVELAGEARAFWDRHHDRLKRAGVLTDADVDSFVVLCQTWARVQHLNAYASGAEFYREMVQLNNLLKQYQALARQFGLMPAARKRDKLAGDPPPEKDEFGL